MKPKAKPFWDPKYLGKSVVYLITNVKNGKKYVGQTGCLLKKYRGVGKVIRDAFRKHGDQAFRGKILKVVRDPRDLPKWECHYIMEEDTRAPNGYNLTGGGEGF